MCNSRSFGWLLAGALVGVATIAGAQDVGQKLTGEELRKLYTGGITHGVTFDDLEVTAHYKRDGTVVGRQSRGTDNGKWEIVGDTICVQWNRWREARRYCGTVTRYGDQYQLKVGSRDAVRFSVTRE